MPVLDSELDPDLIASLNVLSWAVWAAFAVAFAIRLWLAEDRWRYAKRHWYDVALVVLQFLRPMRLLRLLAFARCSTVPQPGRWWAGRSGGACRDFLREPARCDMPTGPSRSVPPLRVL